MNITLISNLYPPHVRGGAERIAAGMAAALRDLGHTVTVISACPPGAGAKRYAVLREEWEGVPVWRFFPHNLYFVLQDARQGVLNKLLWHVLDAVNGAASLQMKRLVKESNPDVVITHNLKGIGVYTARALRSLDVPHVHVLHDVQLLEPSGLLYPEQDTLLRKLLRRVLQPLMRFVMGSPRMVVSPTQWLLDMHRAAGFFPGSRVAVLPNPAPEMHGKPNAEWRRFVFVGQIEAHKGIEDVLAAMDEAMLDTRFTAELDVVGDGALRDALVERYALEPRIHFHGKLPRERIAKLLADAHAVVMPSRCMENYPGVIAEAFAFGVPVLASAVGGVPEMVKPHESGWLFSPGDVPSLATLLRHIAAHPKENAALREKIALLPRLDPVRHAEKLLQLFTETKRL